MPFPSPEWITYCQESPWLQEGWEPRFGDFVLTDENHIGFVLEYVERAKWVLIEVPGDDEYSEYFNQEQLIFLPRQDQLVELLEEEGKPWRQGQIDPLYKDAWLKEGLIKPGDDYWASIRPEIGDEKRIICYGPCPEIALAEALKTVREE